jgi:tRNA pseudouridine55 synthase
MDTQNNRTERRRRAIHGWIVLDKPEGMTSTEAVARVKRMTQAEKAGHAGTLDPLASGLLPIALGEATKTVSFAMEGKKTYRFTVTWGEERTTCDREGEVSALSDSRPSPAQITEILPRFTGTFPQVPPAFSAIKVAGERAYDRARAGEEVELAPRMVSIDRLVLLGHLGPDCAEFDVSCGKGTYIRALGRDMGRELGVYGYVSALRRTAVGPFTEDQMIPLEVLEEIRHKAPGDYAMEGVLRPLETALDGIPALAVRDAEAQRLKQGQPVLLRGSTAPIAQDWVLVTWEGKPWCLATIEQGQLKPKRVFNLS